MRWKLLIVTAAVASLASVVPLPAQPKPGAAELPVTQVVLFSSGVGYYEREGQVEGHSRIDLQFPMSDINDLLKSLVLQDMGGGQVSTINYDNRNPIEMTLKSFAIDLTRNPSMADLLNQARGEKVEVVTTVDNKNPVVGQSETINGTIVGVEKQRQAAGKDQVIEISQVNLLTADGLRGVPMAQVQKVRFLKPALEQEFKKALEVLATGHDKQKKTVSLNFTGEGKRSVRVGYVTESPIWKTSYRLALKDTKLFLQGWAVVENTTDEDWSNVQLGLVSGRPVSFQMDLYQPLFVQRPMVELELFASLRPQTYGGNLEREEEAKPMPMDAPVTVSPPAPGGFGGRGGSDKASERQRALQYLKKGDEKRKDGLELGQSVASAATTTELGEYFEYHIRQPVSLPRQKSALIPIVNQEVAGSKVSIYNETVHTKFPLLGLRFKNSTSLHLCQGPITVFEKDSYAGDAKINDVQPNETRLISYAIDLGTEVEPKVNFNETLQTVKVFKGIVWATFKQRESKTYTIKNRSPHARTVLIEHPYRQPFVLVSPQKAAERSRDLYRFEVAAEPNKPVTQEVVEELPRIQQLSLNNSDDESVRFFIRAAVTGDKVKKALERALVSRKKVSDALRDVQNQERALRDIEQDQTRMRANLKEVPPTSEAYKRYVKKFDEQETEIEKRQKELARLRDLAEKEKSAYESFLANLNIDE